MPYPNFHSARVRSPGDFARIVVLQTLPNGIMIYGGPLKSDPKGSGKPQAYRFPKNKFTIAQSKAWLKEHNIKYILFEPASKITEKNFYKEGVNNMLNIEKALQTTETASQLIPERLDPMLVELADKELPLRRIFKRIPWDTNSFEWNERSALIGGSFYNEDDEHSADKSTHVRRQAPIKMCKGDGGVSNLLIKTSKRYINSLQSEIESATKGCIQAEENAYINGDEDVDSDEFDGLRKLVTLEQNVADTIDFGVLDKAIQTIADNGGKAGLILLSGRDVLELYRILRAKGQIDFARVEVDPGLVIPSYQGIPLIHSTYMPTTLGYGATAADGYSVGFVLDLTHIAVPVVQDITYEEVASTKDAITFRVKEYLAFAVKAATKKHVKLINIEQP